MKPRILFVDDEPHVLQGLQRGLRSQRQHWDMAFCESGSLGLEELGKSPCDVVVSDKKMPGMGGAEFLALVTHLHPDTIRIVLSGYSEPEPVLEALGRPHFTLNKPCDTDLVHRTIQAALAAKPIPAAGTHPVA